MHKDEKESCFVVINSKIRFNGDCQETRPHCGAVCCKNTIVLLLPEEKESGKYQYQNPTEGCNCNACQIMRSTGNSSLQRTDTGCIYLDGVGKCSIYDDRPTRCRDYDCKKVWWNLGIMSRATRDS